MELKLWGNTWGNHYFRCVSVALHNTSDIECEGKLDSCRIWLVNDKWKYLITIQICTIMEISFLNLNHPFKMQVYSIWSVK